MTLEQSVLQCLAAARARIDPGEAALLLQHVLERPQSWLYAHGDAGVPTDAAARFRDLVARRAAGEPVAYLMGRRGFWTLDLAVTQDTLIPRPDTELLVELALARLDAGTPARVADLVVDLVNGSAGLLTSGVSPGDIALLAPVGSGLDVYERALDERGLAVASQAGKGFFRRQEVQDLVALTRALADLTHPSDRSAPSDRDCPTQNRRQTPAAILAATLAAPRR